MTRLVLASASPRRRDILASLGVPFELLPVLIPESANPAEPAETMALRLAHEKAAAAIVRLGDLSPAAAPRAHGAVPPAGTPPATPSLGAERRVSGPELLVLGADTV